MFTKDPTKDTEFCFDLRQKVSESIDFYDAVERDVRNDIQGKMIKAVSRPAVFIRALQSVARSRIQAIYFARDETLVLAQGVRVPFRSLLVRKR